MGFSILQKKNNSKKNIFLILFLFISFNTIYSQEYSRKWGEISRAEKDLKFYEKDPEAEAVVLFDIGESYFYDTKKGYDIYFDVRYELDYKIRFTRTKRIKILKDAGNKYAEVTIPYYVNIFGETELILELDAYAYNYDNGQLSKTRLDKSTIYEESINDRWHAQKFVIPNVKKGTIIEYTYVLETPFLFNLPDWHFQDRIPTIYSEYTARIIPFYEYTFFAQGINNFDYQLSEIDENKRQLGNVVMSGGKNVGTGKVFQDMVHIFAMKDVPAFKDESYITSINDYIKKIDFQLDRILYTSGDKEDFLTTWPNLIDELIKKPEFGRYLKKCNNYTKKIVKSEIDISQSYSNDIAEKIIKYVKSSFNWNGTYSKYTTKTPREFIAKKSGTSADINLFLASLLQSAGIQAEPVILSTRDHGHIKIDYPYAHFFNHVIVLVKTNTQTFLTDATENFTAYNRIPPKCINGKGFVVAGKKVRWIELNTNPISYEIRKINLEINSESLTAAATIQIQSNEYKGFDYRKTYKNDSAQIKEFLLSKGFLTISEVNTDNYNTTKLPYLINGKGDIILEKREKQILVYPFLNFPLDENKLTQRRRLYPVDFIYPSEETFHSIISVPNTYKVNSLPKNFTLNNELVYIDLDYQLIKEGIEVIGKYTFKKAVYTPKEYPRIKSYINTIIKEFNSAIVIDEI